MIELGLNFILMAGKFNRKNSKIVRVDIGFFEFIIAVFTEISS